MSKSDLAIILSKLKGFPFPDPSLEQYMTDSEVAAQIIWDAFMQGDVEKKRVADLGCGTGILGIGALIMNADNLIFVEKDALALKIAEKNLRVVEDHVAEMFEGAEFMNMDVMEFCTPVDTVIMNPPFGTRDAGADVAFLTQAMKMANVVYSLHKASTKEYLREFIRKQGFKIKYEKEFQMPLKQTMAFHEKKIERIAVICLGMQKVVEQK